MVKHRWGLSLATFTVMIGSFVTILIPFWGLYQLLSTKISYALNHSTQLMQGIQKMDNSIFEIAGIRLLTDDTMIKLQSALSSIIPEFLGKTASVLTDIGMMYFILYFLLMNTGKSEKFLQRILPIHPNNTVRFSDELQSMVYSNILGAPVLAIIQGFSAGLGFLIFGLDEPWFWGVICGFMSFIPLIGTAIVWIPAGIYQLINGETWQGAGIIIFGALVITNIDNVFRFVIQKKFADVHPLVTVLGVIVGLNWFGLPGIIFGPLLFSYFLLMVKMYNEEYGESKPEAENETL